MSGPLTQARQKVADALADVTVPVLPHMPRAAPPPCVIVTPGNPWVEVRGTVTFDVIVVAAAYGWTQLEDTVAEVRDALWAAGIAPGPTNQPTSDASTVSASTPVTLRTSCH